MNHALRLCDLECRSGLGTPKDESAFVPVEELLQEHIQVQAEGKGTEGGRTVADSAASKRRSSTRLTYRQKERLSFARTGSS